MRVLYLPGEPVQSKQIKGCESEGAHIAASHLGQAVLSQHHCLRRHLVDDLQRQTYFTAAGSTTTRCYAIPLP